MKVIATLLVQCLFAQNLTFADYEEYEDSLVRAEKSIALYKEVVRKALYCKFVQTKRSKYIFRFRKTALDITWHVKNGCNSQRDRRDVDLEALNSDRFFYKVGKGKVMFDYDEFDAEGYSDIDEEIDQALFNFFVSDYEDQPSVNYQFGNKRSRSFKKNKNASTGTNSTPKAIKMVKDSLRIVRKVSYSLVKDFAGQCPKNGKWMRRLAVLIKDAESSWKQCLKIAPNA